MNGGAVEYRKVGCIRPWRRKIDKDKARGIAGLAAQMRRIAERGNKRVVRIVRLGGYVIAPSREPIER